MATRRGSLAAALVAALVVCASAAGRPLGDPTSPSASPTVLGLCDCHFSEYGGCVTPHPLTRVFFSLTNSPDASSDADPPRHLGEGAPRALADPPPRNPFPHAPAAESRRPV